MVAGAYIRLQREDFSSEEEFLKWKGWSDEDYHTRDIENNTYWKHTVNIEGTPKQEGGPSPELLLFERYDQMDRAQFYRLLLEGINTCLSEPQRRRLLKYYFEGQTEVEIAAAEGGANPKLRKAYGVQKKT